MAKRISELDGADALVGTEPLPIVQSDVTKKTTIDDIKAYVNKDNIPLETTPPADPQAGDLWWNSQSGILYIYYVDNDSSQWVSTGVGPQGPTQYPAAGIAVSTGSSWAASKTVPGGDVVGTTDSQTLSNKTLASYQETGVVLDVVDDQDSTYSVTVPLDGRLYAVTATQDLDLLTSNQPTAPICASAVLYLTQSTPARAIGVPATWYWSNGQVTQFDLDGAVYCLTLVTDPAGNTHAIADVRQQG